MDAKFPEGLLYTKDHEWAKVEGNIATIGITHHAQDALGEIVFVDLPQTGRQLNKGDAFGAVESIKAVSDLYSPVSGKVVSVNSDLSNEPGKINSEPYQSAWMVKVELSDMDELKALLDVKAYRSLVDSL
jgi:glycine cleavage system H protein